MIRSVLPARMAAYTRQYRGSPHVRYRMAILGIVFCTRRPPAAISHCQGRRARRWAIERLHSWLNRSRQLLVRWEKLERIYVAFLHLACALLCFRQWDRLRPA